MNSPQDDILRYNLTAGILNFPIDSILTLRVCKPGDEALNSNGLHRVQRANSINVFQRTFLEEFHAKSLICFFSLVVYPRVCANLRISNVFVFNHLLTS